MPTFTRVLITLCVGAGAILAWQSYGDAVRRIIASLYSQLGWLAPRTTPIAYRAPGQQRFNAISIDLEAIRQVGRIAVITQEQITRNPQFGEYVIREHRPPVWYRGDVRVGWLLPGDVTLYAVPREYHVRPGYRYAIVNDLPVIVEPRSE
jgi:hypothetical protein